MRRKKPREMTVWEVMVQRVGIKRVQSAMTFCVAWGVCADDLRDQGRWPTTLSDRVHTYAEYWGLSKAKAWRELSIWREALPEYADPDDFYVFAKEVMGDRYSPEATMGMEGVVLA